MSCFGNASSSPIGAARVKKCDEALWACIRESLQPKYGVVYVFLQVAETDLTTLAINNCAGGESD